MTQLLVRNLEPTVIKRLKERARLHGVAVEEEHRRILREVCLQPLHKVSLINFLRNPDNAASPTIELDLARSRETESRPLDF
jgi:plasmid stability protein